MGFLHPNVPFALLLVAIYASLFHLWAGRNLRDLGLYFLAGLVGFALGHWIGRTLELDVLRIGTLHVVEGSVSAFLALILVRSFQTP